MAAVEIVVGAAWMVLGAVMVWSGLFDRSVTPGWLGGALRVPGAMAGGVVWLVRFAMRLALGGPRRAKARVR